MSNGTFKNTNIEQGFYLRELGLYAIDPDTQDEVLFAYVNYGEGAEYINNSIAERKEYFYDLIVTVDNAENVTIVVNQSSAYITEKELQEEVERLTNLINTKSDIPKSKNITLLSTGWTLNETTQKYEYTYTDNTITENDYIMIEILDKEKEEAMSNAKWETANGSIKFTNDEQVEIDVMLQIVAMRTKAEEVVS